MNSDTCMYVCRLCMEKEGLSTIFKMCNGVSLDIKIMECVVVHIQRDDRLPLWICKSCESKVNLYYDFRRESQNTQVKLLQATQYNIKQELSEDERETSESPQQGPLISQQTNCMENEFSCKQTLEKIYQCEQCGHTFKHLSGLKKHALTHSQLKPYSCMTCGKSYTRAEHLLVHARAHSGSRPFICEVCARGFTQKQDLLRHRRVHSDEKKFACPRCGRRFKRSADIHTHMRSHTGARPYKCPTCPRTYTSHSGLRKHTRNPCINTQGDSNDNT